MTVMVVSSINYKLSMILGCFLDGTLMVDTCRYWRSWHTV